MIRAYIIGESMRPGTSLGGLKATMVSVDRQRVSNAARNQPQVWTVVTFETTLGPDALASKFSEIIDDQPALWYTHFRAGEDMFVIFPRKVIRYRAGDTAGKTQAQEYARSIGVPGRQIDWDEA